jgi:hypothetical protein
MKGLEKKKTLANFFKESLLFDQGQTALEKITVEDFLTFLEGQLH